MRGETEQDKKKRIVAAAAAAAATAALVCLLFCWHPFLLTPLSSAAFADVLSLTSLWTEAKTHVIIKAGTAKWALEGS